MINAYTTSNDYERALQSIGRIERPSKKVLAAKQNVLFQLGAQSLSNDDVASALDYFEQARSLGSYDARVANDCNLWVAECQYRQGDYKGAERSLNSYLASATADDDSGNVALARYNLGYAHFQQRKYAESRKAFAAAVADKRLPGNLRADALNRIGDTYYYARDYETAEDYYEQAYTGDNTAGDYALYQNAGNR